MFQFLATRSASAGRLVVHHDGMYKPKEKTLQAEHDWFEVLHSFLLVMAHHNCYLLISQENCIWFRFSKFHETFVPVWIPPSIIYSMLFVFCVPHVSTRQGIAEFPFQRSMMFKPLKNFHTLRTHRMAHLRNGPFWAKPTISRNDRAPQLCCGQKAGQEEESTKTQLLVSQ